MALGKSLGNILGDYFGDSPDLTINNNPSIQQILLSEIRTTELQTRTFFDQKAIESLANSIQENGLIHPILLIHSDGGYNLISGERRFRASKHLNLKTIPAIVKEKNSLNDAQKTMLMAVENLQREGLSPLEQAKTYQLLMDTKKINEHDLAKTFNVSFQYIRNYIRLLGTSTPVQQALAQKVVSEGQIRPITPLAHADQNIIIKQIVNKNMTVKEVEKLVRNYRPVEARPLKERVGHKIPSNVVYEVEKISQLFPNSKIKFTGDQESGRITIAW